MTTDTEKLRRLSALVRELLDAHPVFRSMPIGAPNSLMRQEQERAMRLEDEIKEIVR